MSAVSQLTAPTLQDHLRRLGACVEAREWAADRALEAAWADCPNGSWLLWLAAKAGVDRRLVVEAACRCAEAVIGLVPEGEERPIRAIDAARAWIRGEVSLEEIRAAYAAANAANAAAAAYAANAAYAADAADAANAAYAYAAAYAAYAANAAYAAAAAYAAYAAADARTSARAEALADCADLVRQVITAKDVAKALEGSK